MTFKASDRIERIDEGGYNHVVIGHHGSGTVRLSLSSTTEMVIRADEVAVTVIQ